jgi:hypothetical protein
LLKRIDGIRINANGRGTNLPPLDTDENHRRWQTLALRASGCESSRYLHPSDVFNSRAPYVRADLAMNVSVPAEKRLLPVVHTGKFGLCHRYFACHCCTSPFGTSRGQTHSTLRRVVVLPPFERSNNAPSPAGISRLRDLRFALR